ncbi:hypothetical protein BG006_007970 [Podila minutissima]|uniref:DUF605-domain-containing protein n=1 Tax=Podila minutissima TaxID=64525 RepID=A0A9P5SRC0_9FUNG|nr:hypothetical protein BG006_007970 [Podila minutissima]
MSAANVPEGLKNITPFLQRAAQLQERDPVVSYYANYYAAKLAIAKASKDNRAFIDELLNVLEKQRKDIGDNEAISNDLVGYAHIENFAIKIFSKADDEDHEGQSSQKTAKNFVAAANFLELLKVFGDIDAEIEEKIKYAKWRAADIIKAIRDGRQPTPPPGGNKPKQSLAESSTGEFQDNANVLSPTFDASNAHPTAAATFPPAQPSSIGSVPTFPTISNFPSPPLGSANIHMGAGGNSWHTPQQPPPSNLNVAPQNQSQSQNQNLYNPAGSPSPSTFSPPMSAAPVSNINNSLLGSGYLPPSTPSTIVPSNVTQPNPMAPPPSQPTGYGYNNNYQQPHTPVVPSPTPSQSYAQSYYSQPSAPYQQQQPAYSPVPIVLDPAVNTQVQKHCKWTVSALTYDDIPTAIDNLEKALALLRPYHNKQ